MVSVLRDLGSLQLGVAWWTVMDQVIDRGTPLTEDPARLDPPLGDPIQAPVRTVGGTRPHSCAPPASTRPINLALFATGIADLTAAHAIRVCRTSAYIATTGSVHSDEPYRDDADHRHMEATSTHAQALARRSGP